MMLFRRLLILGVLALILGMGARTVASEPARLTVQSDPAGASVVLDGKELNIKTPIRLNVAPGVHSLTLIMDGYERVTRNVEVYSGTAFADFKLIAVPGAPPERVIDAPKPAPQPEKTRAPQPPAAAAPEAAVTLRGPVKIEPRENKTETRPDPVPENNSWNLLPEDNPFKDLINSLNKKDRKSPAEDASPEAETEDEVNKADIFPLLTKEDPAPAPPAAIEDSQEDEADDAVAEDEADFDQADASAPSTLSPPPSSPDAAAAPVAGPTDPGSYCLEGDTMVAVSDDGPQTCAPAARTEWPDSVEKAMFAAARDLPHFPEKFNVLLLGLDRRDARGMLATGAPYTEEQLKRKPANSDVMMVIQLDFIAHQVRMVSIPRDTKVTYHGRRSRGKINAAYAYGREQMARATVEDFLNIKIHRTVVADWRGTKKCIALFKGLGLDYNGFDEKELFWHLRKRSFARGDFRRIERQQRFLQYAGTEYLRLNNETRNSEGAAAAVTRMALDLAIQQGMSVIETDLSYQEVQLLAYVFRDYNLRELTMAQVSGSGRLEGGGGEDTSGIYFFNPSPKHTFDEIIAKVEAQIKEDRDR